MKHRDKETAVKSGMWNAKADRVGVRVFSEAMRDKLEQKRKEGRGGWHQPGRCHVDKLARMRAST